MRTRPRIFPNDGFTLVEVTLALGIAAFCLVTLLGLLPVGMSANQEAGEAAGAVNVLGAVASDLRSAGIGATFSPGYAVKFPAAGATETTELFASETGEPLGPTTGPVPTRARYRVTARLTAPAAGRHESAAAYLRATWPAGAPSARAASASEIVTTFPR